jgi:hypothetical protein
MAQPMNSRTSHNGNGIAKPTLCHLAAIYDLHSVVLLWPGLCAASRIWLMPYPELACMVCIPVTTLPPDFVQPAFSQEVQQNATTYLQGRTNPCMAARAPR